MVVNNWVIAASNTLLIQRRGECFFPCHALCSNRIVFISYLLLFLVWFLKETRGTQPHTPWALCGNVQSNGNPHPPFLCLLFPGLTCEPSGQFQSSLIYIMNFSLYQAGENRCFNRRDPMDGCAEERPHLSLVFP